MGLCGRSSGASQSSGWNSGSGRFTASSISQMSSIIMWNCRGAKKKATTSYVHHLLEVHNPVLFALVETKVSEFQRKEVDPKGSAAEILNKKCLKTLRALFFWSKNKLQELSNSKVKLEAILLQLQQEECTEKGLNQEQIQEMKAIGMELQSVLARINSWWIQRAKCQWIQEGDSNSRFFQSVASLKRNCNRICSLKNSVGETLVDKVDIASELANFFEAKWGSKSAYGNSLDSVVHKPSRAWHILQDGWRSLKRVVRWKIGNGDSISILKDIWLLDRRLEDWPTFYSTTIDESGRVGDLLQDGRWKEQEIRDLFGPCLADLILSISVFSVYEVDKPELINSTISCSISRQVFEAQFKHKDERFGWLKGVKLLPRESMFWWRAIHDAIPTQDWMVRRGLEISELCVWGCLVKEDLNHIMYHCKFSHDVFAVLWRWGFQMPCLQEESELEKDKVLYFTQADTLFLKTVYQIWINRNKMKHCEGSVSPNMVAAFVLGNFNLVNLSILWKQWDTNRLYLIDYSWCPPPSNWLKVNFDGAYKIPYRAGLGIVVRDATGNLIVAAGKKVLHWDVNFIELQSIALLKEVMNEELLRALGIIIEGDNQKVLQWLYKNIKMGRWKYNSLDFDLSFLKNFHHVIINFMPRRFNRAADFCAKQALNYSFC
ncbi:hypothetical protein M5K25_001822 [Dendrobium thyrsiflorum]|uniref:RNase H type-1 domain-containing protein n=1 Tax=Dendrobium thyrsiflorum TaxID=117978 RepID=A0ABD0VRT9_DENTH